MPVIAAATAWPKASYAEGATKAPKKPRVLETENGIKYIDIKKGDGPFPSEGDYVVINYTGFLSNGTLFDTTEGKGKRALSFRYIPYFHF